MVESNGSCNLGDTWEQRHPAPLKVNPYTAKTHMVRMRRQHLHAQNRKSERERETKKKEKKEKNKEKKEQDRKIKLNKGKKLRKRTFRSFSFLNINFGADFTGELLGSRVSR